MIAGGMGIEPVRGLAIRVWHTNPYKSRVLNNVYLRETEHSGTAQPSCPMVLEVPIRLF